MPKKIKIKSKISKITKSKKNNINIKIHIDQSKKTTGGNLRKSNIKTLPAYNSIPSGPNYVRQFSQDPYYSQSQYEHMNNLKQYNQLLQNQKQNPQILGGFNDNNKNDQMLIKDLNNSTINREYNIKDDDAYSLDTKESVYEEVVDYAMNVKQPENALLLKNSPQKLPFNDLNTKEELINYDDDGNKGIIMIDYENINDDVANAMKNKEEFLNDYKLYYNESIPTNKIFNELSGKYIRNDDKNYFNSSDLLKKSYLNDPYLINKSIQNIIGSDYEYSKKNLYWWQHHKNNQPDALQFNDNHKNLKSSNVLSNFEEKADDDEEDELTNTSKTSVFEKIKNSISPKKKVKIIEGKTRKSTDTTKSKLFKPKKTI